MEKWIFTFLFRELCHGCSFASVGDLDKFREQILQSQWGQRRPLVWVVQHVGQSQSFRVSLASRRRGHQKVGLRFSHHPYGAGVVRVPRHRPRELDEQWLIWNDITFLLMRKSEFDWANQRGQRPSFSSALVRISSRLTWRSCQFLPSGRRTSHNSKGMSALPCLSCKHCSVLPSWPQRNCNYL